MKQLIAAFLVALSFTVSAAQDTNLQSNDSVVNSTSAMQNVQVNNNNDSYIRMGDIECPTPSLSASASGGEHFDSMVSVSVHYPLGTSTCKRMAESSAAHRLHVSTVELNRRGIMFEKEVALMCLALHSVVQITEDNPLYEKCSKIKPINEQHRHDLPVENYPDHRRVSDH